MKKVITIVWTRPEVIRLSEIIKRLDIYTKHVFVHTWQNYTPELHDQFFQDLQLRKPDYQLNIQEKYSWVSFIWYMMKEVESIIKKEKPDVALILWDTNSCLSAYVCRRNNVPVFHMEAGNRCYDENVPEELNRRMIDSLSTFLLPYTQRSREILLQEWCHPSKIIVTWNPISEIVDIYKSKIKERIIKEDYVLVTIHRNENVTDKNTLQKIIKALNKISEKYKVLLSMHPKLVSMIEKYDIVLQDNIQQAKPFNFQEFLNLEKYAECVISDSWTVPEECAILKTPCILIRTSTERPELLENNSMILSWVATEDILTNFEVAKNMSIWEMPSDYVSLDVSEKIVKLVLRHIK